MNPPGSSHQRLHDLDALRAVAMLIGIVYHAALSFAVGFPWLVQDVVQAKWPFLFQAWVHGFRMQLFMLVSGFFTAMLWRRKGLKALLWHRTQRVLFPCLLSLITVVPSMIWAADFAFRHAAAHRPTAATPPAEPASANLWSAIRHGDTPALTQHLDAGANPTNLHPIYAITPLQWAALNGQRDAIALLLERGSPVDVRSRDGHTALHGAAFMGHPDVLALLLEKGADPNIRSTSGETPVESARTDIATVQYIAGVLSLPVDPERWIKGRQQVRSQLEAAGERNPGVTAGDSSGADSKPGLEYWLVHMPVFTLIWFLWFLVWLIALFSLYAMLMDRVGRSLGRPTWLLSRWTLLWLVPLTAIPTALMDFDLGIGPDTSMGILPMPHVLAYYAIFFFFGVLYHDCDDRECRLGAGWRWTLPVTLLLVFPVAMELTAGTFGFRDRVLPRVFHPPVAALTQSLFAWGMCFGSIGLFRSFLTRENPVIRYLSDSAYWLYLAHLPLCISGQALISQWQAPTWVKLPLLSVTLTAFLLLTYHFLVRYTWVGRLLNGPRKRPGQPALPSATP